MPNIAIASDHRGYKLKEVILEYLRELDLDYIDFGPDVKERVDYPEFASYVAQYVSRNLHSKGILICGTGNGMNIVANKYPNVYSVLCNDVKSARLGREHNDANILVIGADYVDEKTAKKIVKVWLTTKFAGGRYKRRIEMIKEIEKGLYNSV